MSEGAFKRVMHVAGGSFLLYTGGTLLWNALFGEVGRGPLSRALTKTDDAPARLIPADVRARLVKVRSVEDRGNVVAGLIHQYGEDAKMHVLAGQILGRQCATGHCVPEKNWPAEVRELFRYVRKNVRYMRDPLNMDTFNSPWRTLQMRSGDCGNVTVLLGALLEASGYPVALRIIQTTDSPGGANHIYNLAGLPPNAPTAWAPLDASMDVQPGWEAPGASEVARAGYGSSGITARVWTRSADGRWSVTAAPKK